MKFWEHRLRYMFHIQFIYCCLLLSILHLGNSIFRYNSLLISFYTKFVIQVSSGVSDSCPISRKTVKIVDGCPDSGEKWREAAARKNCGAYASKCDEPERLVYHCVINPYVNKTLEVCAYAQNIALGMDFLIK